MSDVAAVSVVVGPARQYFLTSNYGNQVTHDEKVALYKQASAITKSGVSWAALGAAAVDLMLKKQRDMLVTALSHFTVEQLNEISEFAHQAIFSENLATSSTTTTPVPTLTDERPSKKQARRR
jgi:hypothetical protein